MKMNKYFWAVLSMTERCQIFIAAIVIALGLLLLSREVNWDQKVDG
jgi:hypothetical protein